MQHRSRACGLVGSGGGIEQPHMCGGSQRLKITGLIWLSFHFEKSVQCTFSMFVFEICVFSISPGCSLLNFWLRTRVARLRICVVRYLYFIFSICVFCIYICTLSNFWSRTLCICSFKFVCSVFFCI